jgi:lipopolysaccharide exporter
MRATSDPPRSEVSDPEPARSDSRSLSASVRRGALWVVATNLLLRLANVLIIAVVARILSPHDFGVFAVAMTAYLIVSSIGELGVSHCLIRADLDIDSLAPTVATISFLSSAILAGAMVAFARPIGTALGSAAAAGPIRVMALAVLLVGVFAVPNSQMTRDFKQKEIFLANVISLVPSTALLIILAKSGDGATAFAWSRVAGVFVVGCVLIAAAPRRYRPGLARSALSVILRFGIPLAGANFVNYILLNVDYAFVGHLLGATALGFYVLAFTVASWPTGLLGSMINSVSMPAFSRVKHDADLLKNAMATALRGISLVIMPMCGMMIALARPLVLTLYGAKWAASANVLVVLSLYGAVSVVCLLFANMLAGLGRTKFLLVLQLIWIGCLVPAMALGVHKDGIVGAAYAHVAVIVPIVLPSYLLALKRVTGVRFTALGKAALPALLASSAAALAARGAASQLNSPLAELIAGLAAGGLIYVVCAGRQAIAVFGRGQAAERVLHFYSAAARLAGLPAEGRSKHAAKYSRGRAAEAPKHTGPLHGSIVADPWGQPGTERDEDLAVHANLTYAYRDPGSLAQAVALRERTLADRERLLGPDHPHTLASRANLAFAYCQAGWPTKAIPLYERTLDGWNRLLGSDHPSTLRSSNYLAGAYREAGRLAEAIPLYERTLAGWQQLLGSDHPSTLRSNKYLADAYREAGRPAEAIPSRSRHLRPFADSAWRVRCPVLLAVALSTLAVAGIVIFRVGPGLGHAAAAKPAVTRSVVGHRHTGPSAPSHPAPTTARRARGSARPTAAARVLVPVSAAAFGPAGSGSGDNPQNAYKAIDASTATAWATDWYRTAQFGGLEADTGLLIDMGRPVSITSVQIILGSARGADLQLLTGNAPALAKLRLQASASDAGGTLRLNLARPERARYLLIWFTLLPPDSSGTFEASVYNVRLEGTP